MTAGSASFGGETSGNTAVSPANAPGDHAACDAQMARLRAAAAEAAAAERERIRELAARHAAICVCRCGTGAGDAGPGHPRKFADLIGPAPQDLTAAGAGPLLDPDCRAGKHGSCVGAPCECDCHQEALP